MRLSSVKYGLNDGIVRNAKRPVVLIVAAVVTLTSLVVLGVLSRNYEIKDPFTNSFKITRKDTSSKTTSTSADPAASGNNDPSWQSIPGTGRLNGFTPGTMQGSMNIANTSTAPSTGGGAAVGGFGGGFDGNSSWSTPTPTSVTPTTGGQGGGIVPVSDPTNGIPCGCGVTNTIKSTADAGQAASPTPLFTN